VCVCVCNFFKLSESGKSSLQRMKIDGLHFEYCRLVPAGETEFAKDASFGYKSSNLREVLILPTRESSYVI